MNVCVCVCRMLLVLVVLVLGAGAPPVKRAGQLFLERTHQHHPEKILLYPLKKIETHTHTQARTHAHALVVHG